MADVDVRGIRGPASSAKHAPGVSARTENGYKSVMSQASLESSIVVEGRYQLETRLEGWGIGEVWKARDKNFRNRPVAMKFLGGGVDASAELPDIAMHVKGLRGLRHGSVLPYINQGAFGPKLWVTQDFFDGVPLPVLIEEGRRARGRLEGAQAEACFDAVIAALAAAHAAQGSYVHGCLQPSAVIVKRGAWGDLKILDFGLGPYVTTVHDRETLRPYQAPEQREQDMALTSRADVHALGVLLLELVATQPAGSYLSPVEGILTSITAQGFPASVRAQHADVPGGIWDVIARAVSRSPEARFAHAGEMRDAVRKAWVERAPSSASSARAPEAAPRPPTIAPTPGGPKLPGAIAPPSIASLQDRRFLDDPKPVSSTPAWELPSLGPSAAPALPPLPSVPAGMPAPLPVAPPGIAPPPPRAASPWDSPAPVPASAPLSSAWDAAAPSAIPTGASLSSAWDPQPVQGVWAPPPANAPNVSGDWAAAAWEAPAMYPTPAPPLSAPPPARDVDFEAGATLQPQRFKKLGQEFQSIAEESPYESTRALDVEAFRTGAGLDSKIAAARAGVISPESTMALDLSAFSESPDTQVGVNSSTPTTPPAPVTPRAGRGDEDWRDSVVVLDTANARRSGGYVQNPALAGGDLFSSNAEEEDEGFDPLESRTITAAPLAVGADAMKTTVPSRRGAPADPGYDPVRSAAADDQGETLAAGRFARSERSPQRIATMPPARNNPLAPAPAPVAANDAFRASGPPSYEPLVERTQLGIPTVEALARGQGHLPGMYPPGGFPAPPMAPPAPEPKKKPWFTIGLAVLFLAAIGAVFLVLSMRAH
jgi:serine/threonine-protein kinase